MADKFKNILIIKPSAIGDIVFALPALSAIRAACPDARIAWLIRTEYAQLLEGHPYLDEIIIFDRKFLGRWYLHPKVFGELVKFLKNLRKKKFDCVFDFQGLFRTAFFGWVTGAKNRLGMSNARECAPFFYTKKVSQDDESIHLIDFYLKMVSAAGLPVGKAEFVLPIAPEAEQTIDKKLSSQNIDTNKFAVIVPGAAHPDKCWPAESFARLADRIAERFGLSIIAVGSDSEKGIVEQINKLAKTAIVDFAGKTSLAELAALVKQAAIVIGNDTGASHIAAALDRPIVIIFGRTNPARVAPYKRENSFVAANPFGRGPVADNFDAAYDIKKITVDKVFEVVCRNIS